MKAISLLIFLTACASRQVDPTRHPIRYTLLSKTPEARECYLQTESYKKDNVGFSLIYHFDIQQDGSTANQRITDSTVQEENFKNCFLKVMSTLKFPPPGGEGVVSVKQPFNFYPTK